MKKTSGMILALLGLSACGDYQGLTANCFDGRNTTAYASSVATRAANGLSFASETDRGLFTSTLPSDDCAFVPLGAPAVAGTE